jgi:hypothetical protein
MNIPEGWKLVPIEPTSNMRVAYYDCIPSRQFNVASQKWKAMLSAAPTPPAQLRNLVKPHVDEIRSIAVNCGFKLKEQPGGDMDLNPYVYTFAHELVSHFCASNRVDAHETGNVNDKQENEPVAWMIELEPTRTRGVKQRVFLGHNAIGDYRASFPDATSTPLYTHPADDKLRKAAVEVLDELEALSDTSMPFKQGIRLGGIQRRIKALRAALEGK